MNLISESENSGNLLALVAVVDDVLFSFDTEIIQEVVQVKKITPVHHAAPYIVGVMNLRGRVITVFDLGCRLGLEQVEHTDDNRILIIEWNQEYIGVVVEKVAEVIQIEKTKIKPAPGNVGRVQAVYISGVCKTNDESLACLLNIDQLFAVEEIKQAD
ncbi:MAG TPA: chemotaxis protein CheW [Chitinispirillaceae bacterium]|nr:chemotaxis protein CheW [Chitinispirillaceae bacterium]